MSKKSIFVEIVVVARSRFSQDLERFHGKDRSPGAGSLMWATTLLIASPLGNEQSFPENVRDSHSHHLNFVDPFGLVEHARSGKSNDGGPRD
jgi:hypothetical protein